jgi:hypothetical protein
MTYEASLRRAAEAGAPHRGRGRAAHGSGQGQPMGPPRPHHGPRRLPARPKGFRDQVDFRTATLPVRRVKKGTPSTPSATSCAPCGGCSASRSRSQPSYSPRSGERRSPQRGLPAWSSAQAPKRSWALKPTRTCCGTHAATRSLANRGHDTRALQAYLGHRNIQHTVRYSELAPTRFKDFWRR